PCTAWPLACLPEECDQGLERGHLIRRRALIRPGAALAIHPTRLEPYPLGRDDLPRRVPHMEHLPRRERVMAHNRPKEPILRIPFVHPQTLRGKAPVEGILAHVLPHHRLIRITG